MIEDRRKLHCVAAALPNRQPIRRGGRLPFGKLASLSAVFAFAILHGHGHEQEEEKEKRKSLAPTFLCFIHSLSLYDRPFC